MSLDLAVQTDYRSMPTDALVHKPVLRKTEFLKCILVKL